MPTFKTGRSNLEYFPARESIAVSRWGDVFQLGRHLVACGTPHYLRHVIGDRHAKLCLVEPPAGLLSVRDNRERRDRERDDGDLASLAPNADLMGMSYDALDVMKSVSTPDGLAYVFTDLRHVTYLQSARATLEIRSLELFAWNRGDRGLSRPTSRSDELCCVFQTGAGPAVRISMKAARRQTSPIVQSADDRLGGQSVQKPVELLTSIVSNCTKRGDLVLEPYLRDGSTLIAAELTNRVCVGADEKPLSVDRAIRRWQRMTGKMAHNLIRDESFDELAQRVVNQGLDHVK